MLIHALRAALALTVFLSVAAPAGATWSIVVLNRVTREVAVATSTCIQNSDIATAVPVVRVGHAAGAAQAFVLSNARNRRIIFRNSLRGATPQQLLDTIDLGGGGGPNRQFGIVTFTGDPLTFSGSGTDNASLGITGRFGDYDYAIQGNVLSGDNVVFDCEAAFLNTPGDLGQRMVAAMEAARDAGGDGRCSCSPGLPTSCGSPPPSFTYASYNYAMVIARLGDDDGNCTGSGGCITGSYYLKLTYAGNATTQEPIAHLRGAYDTWRQAQIGRPDGVRSVVTTTMPILQADGMTRSRVTVALVDIDGVPITVGGQAVSLVKREGPLIAGSQNHVDHGDGTHSFEIVSTFREGEATYAIVVDDGIRPVQLGRDLHLVSRAPSELHLGQPALSVADGTALPIVLARGASDAARSYRILGSFSGTTPGTLVGSALVPLRRDRMFNFTLFWPGGEPFMGSAGALDGNGRAEALFAPRPGALGPFVGSTLSWSALVGGVDVTPVGTIQVVP